MPPEEEFSARLALDPADVAAASTDELTHRSLRHLELIDCQAELLGSFHGSDRLPVHSCVHWNLEGCCLNFLRHQIAADTGRMTTVIGSL